MCRFIYYNVNPIGERIEDCVCRAITLATGLPYEVIEEKLYYTGKLLDCEKLCVCCYKHLIENVFNYRRVNCDDMTLGEFADLHPHGIYLVRMNGHISCIIDNDCFDIFDCRSKILTDAWRVY